MNSPLIITSSRGKAAPLVVLTLLVILPVGSRASSAQTAPSVPQLNSSAILGHLNAVINWYRQTTKVRAVGEPSDEIYESNMRQLAVKATQLAFQSAKAQAALAPKSAQTENNADTSTQRIQKRLNDLNAQVSQLQAQIAAFNDQIARAKGSRLEHLTAQRDALAGDLDMNKAMQQVIEQFIKVSDTAASGGLLGSISQLELSVPELAGGSQTSPKPETVQSSLLNSKGLFGKLSLLYQQVESIHEISQLINEAANLKQSADATHGPLLAALHSTSDQADKIATQLTQAQPGTNQAKTGSPAPLPQVTRQQFDAIAGKFKKLADASLPLRQEILVLDQSDSNLTEWRASIQSEFNRNLWSILLQVAAIAIALGIVLLLSELWRRITFRYVHDIRRRRQFLMLRRIVVVFCMCLVLTLGLVSEFSSLATFAGFITAGLAVGLQTILLSVAAYFFLVGRWGIRVGDRISVAGVTGDVVDVGLVRLYLMELAGTSVDLYQTGRIVVFANSVLFQPTTPLFKQLPGTEYTWHEVFVELTQGGNYKLVEEKMLAAVQSVYEGYRADLARQHGDVERRIDIQVKLPEPHALLQYSDAGLEYVVRYPVGLDRVAEVDEKVTRALLEELGKDAGLKDTISGFPKIRAAIKG